MAKKKETPREAALRRAAEAQKRAEERQAAGEQKESAENSQEACDKAGKAAADEAAEAQDSAENAQESSNAEDKAAANSELVTITAKQAQELKDKFDAIQKERDEYLATSQRLQAEFDNFRKRNQSLRADSVADGKRDAVKEFLTARDSLERARDAAKDDTSPLAEGVAMVHRQFETALEKLGVEVLDPINQPFDPNIADAVMSEAQEGVEPHTVIMVLQKGYTLNGKLIRPAMVKVSC